MSSKVRMRGNAVSRDVCDRKMAETRLRGSASLLAVALEGSHDGTATFGPDLRFGYVNRRPAELSGVPAEAWIGKSMAALGCPDSAGTAWAPAWV